MSIIDKTAEAITHLLVRNNDATALKRSIEIVIICAMLTLTYFAKPLMLSIPVVRHYVHDGEKYVGDYVQIIGSGDGRRYSMIKIWYESYTQGYVLRGVQYDPQGHRAIDFKSEKVSFDNGPFPYMEFLWHAQTLQDKRFFDGYTQMSPDDPANVQRLAGRGFFLTFDQPLLRYDLRFLKLTPERLAELKLPSPPGDPQKFVTALHASLQNFPNLQPQEETGIPVPRPQ